jgi:UDP-2,3-diacylglucosamine pyrophosphatase LpxH
MCWFFHGDIFDITMRQSKWLAKLGGHGYDLLILLNRWVNKGLELAGYSRISLSKTIKQSVKQAVQFIDDFESTAIDLALQEGYDRVCCGHIHQPAIRSIERDHQAVTYMNSGDWVEHLTALEFDGDTWETYQFDTPDAPVVEQSSPSVIGADNQGFETMLDELLDSAGIAS